MQTQTIKKGMVQTALKVIKIRGYLGFYDGFSAAAIRQMTCTSLRFSLYECGKDLEMFNYSNSLISKIFTASISGTIGSLVGIPMDVINVRMQTNMQVAAHGKRNYKHFIDALIRIPKEEGWMALYNGGFAAVLKSAIGTTGQLAVYDQVKSELHTRFMMDDDVYLHLKSSFISSIIDAIITQPFDVLKTLMMNAPPGQFPTVAHAIKYMMRFGYWGPYRGLAPTIVRKAPATILLFLIYEQLRINLGSLPLESQ
ncbi:mitochondrial dicarboxylate carrier isoform X1 [Drosophila montana]|uniref:mitochondrial dicarboxylate carrier isoform X1 n=1 Tax=Drosophila montana TaxID=40370 RepID=UPI00313CFB9A